LLFQEQAQVGCIAEALPRELVRGAQHRCRELLLGRELADFELGQWEAARHMQ
jgi:hypothetical protein